MLVLERAFQQRGCIRGRPSMNGKKVSTAVHARAWVWRQERRCGCASRSRRILAEANRFLIDGIWREGASLKPASTVSDSMSGHEENMDMTFIDARHCGDYRLKTK